MSQVRVKQNPPVPLSSRVFHGDRQQVLPLTHHEILSLIAPFSRRGLQADLAASDRAARMLAFKPRHHAKAGGSEPALRETLVLEAEASDRFRLVRRVAIDDDALTGGSPALVSTLTAEGADLDRLLDRIEAVPVRRQIKVYADIPLARSYFIEADAPAPAIAPDSKDDAKDDVRGDFASNAKGDAGGNAGAGPETDAGSVDEASGGPVLIEASARIKGLNLAAKADRRRGMPVEIKLTADPGEELRLPEDLLAVLGWSWRPLVHIVSYWRGTINVARKEPKRTPEIEYKLGRTVTHLARTLDQSPAHFHQAHRRARWRVTFQRAIPLLLGLALLAATPLIRFLDMDDNSILRMLIFHAPPFMLVGFFLMREMPRLEIPPFPRPLLNRAWIVPVAGARKPTLADTANNAITSPVKALKAES